MSHWRSWNLLYIEQAMLQFTEIPPAFAFPVLGLTASWNDLEGCSHPSGWMTLIPQGCKLGLGAHQLQPVPLPVKELTWPEWISQPKSKMQRSWAVSQVQFLLPHCLPQACLPDSSAWLLCMHEVLSFRFNFQYRNTHTLSFSLASEKLYKELCLLS